ncbi:MAG TPA: S8 family serine peptidase [Vicinamibacterales bacterium]|nr:S8 family serine peptidase [Vicinamibacterales bacterium]
MAAFTIASASLPGRTGRGVRIAVVDSGIHAAHPHVCGISGGIAFRDHGGVSCDVVDRLGHGTAVAAAIREKAPDVELIAVKVFDRALAASGRALAEAIRWAASQQVALINLSLGTANPEHEASLTAAAHEAEARGVLIVAAATQADTRWLPGALPRVVAVDADWSRDRHTCEVHQLPDGSLRLRASPYPRPIPGVPPERNLKGLSFAVANATGLLALAIEGAAVRTTNDLLLRLTEVHC